METTLFESPSGPVTNVVLSEALMSVGAHECKTLYIHSGLSFGQPAEGLTRKQLLTEILDVLRSLGVQTLCMPTFTFSFCNGEIYDRQHSRSRMGALNEAFRQEPDAERSLDPLMSVSVIGWNTDLVRNLGEQSIGADSTFDRLARCEDVNFLFLGVQLGACFTYMHYLEWQAQVPYRYDRLFSGEVRDHGVLLPSTKKLFVRHNGVFASNGSFSYESELAERGYLKERAVGGSMVSCVSRIEAEGHYLDMLESNPNYFITEPFDLKNADTTFTAPYPMVAL